MSNRHLAIRIFGPDAALAMAQAIAGVDKKTGKPNPPDWRGIFETMGAAQQCGRVIGSFKNKSPCYICGHPILDIKSISHELRPECEHILPVSQARWYLDLFAPGGDPASPALKLEYAYAHRVCNQAKSDDSFIKPVADSMSKIEYDTKSAKTILNAVKARASKALSKYDQEGIMSEIMRMNVDERVNVIRDETLGKIITLANSLSPAAPGLAVLARTATVIDASRLSKQAATAYQPFSDPAYITKRANFAAGLEAFREKITPKYNVMLDAPLFTAEDKKDPWFADIQLMLDTKRDGLIQDWYTILYKNVAVDPVSGLITSPEQSPAYQNAYNAGFIYVNFRLKMNAYKLLPYISDTVRTNLIKAKCWIVDTILETKSRRDTSHGTLEKGLPLAQQKTLGMFLQAAGISIKDKEISEWVSMPDTELCKYAAKKDLSKLNREDSEYRRILEAEENTPLPSDPYTEEEVFAPSGGKRRRTLRKRKASRKRHLTAVKF